ncbi:HAD-IA family hydrolase [Streptomyces sp. V3I7]|uniref:HAD-IA family hydrolase n=1 Tax=Streptomyces sp. V3I7 TaxID=3042278 RepID=UPI00277DF255|nr:HAD-IA family hydrolase [Streptomyces sp. V3I7]MDQ0988985.1 HAD superfamily hydrolase (TIGR01509 family) [Streptomyces sp. V3I7]
MNERCLILDIGGVLERTPRTGWTDRWEDRLGLPRGTAGRRLADVWAAGAVGAVTTAEVHHEIGARLGLGPADVDAFLSDLWHEYLGTPNTELIDHVAALRSRCRLGILSNSFVGAREREAERYGFDTLVHELVYSHEIGVEKPDPEAYAIAVQRLGVRARDCLFVDDVARNVEAARAVGMAGHPFEGNAGTLARVAGHLDGGHHRVRSH